MAKVLILSKQGDGVPIGLRLASEKHKVDIFVKDSSYRSSLAGFNNPTVVEKANKDEYDLVVADMVGMGKVCDQLTAAGKLVLGGGSFNDKLELDRAFGIDVVKRELPKVKVPKSVEIESKGELLRELQRSAIPLVIKPLNNSPVDLTLVSIDDRNRSLFSVAQEWGDDLVPCVLQEKIEGLEISSEGWFDGDEFVEPFNHTFEKKRLMEGDKGPQTGCQGNVVWPTKGDRLIDAVLKPLAPMLRKERYVGPIDANCIIAPDGIYFLEWTARMGYDAIQAFAELLKVSMFDFLYRVAAKQANFEERTDYLNLLGMAVRLTLPPYPDNKGVDKWRNIKVLDVEPAARRHVWLADVIRVNGNEVVGGVDGVIGCVTARGENIRECKRRVYRTIDNVVISPDVQYRRDVAWGFEDDKDKFDRWCEDAEDSGRNSREGDQDYL